MSTWEVDGDGGVGVRPPDTRKAHLIHVRDAIGGLTSNQVAVTPSNGEVSPYVLDGASAHTHLLEQALG